MPRPEPTSPELAEMLYKAEVERLRARRGQPGLGDAIKEGFLHVDAGMGGAADSLTFGTADEISAAGNAVLRLRPGGPDWRTLYAREHAEELARDIFDQKHRPIARIAGQFAGAAVGTKGPGVAIRRRVNAMTSKGKGDLGERLSDGKTLLSGDLVVARHRPFTVAPGRTTRVDHVTRRGIPVEAKFGHRATLKGNQRLAPKAIPGYRYDHWYPEHLTRFSEAIGFPAFAGSAMYRNRPR